VDIQRVGAQELDVNVVPADVFEQDKTDPKNPVLRLRDWLLDILSLRVASATLTNAAISQATVGSADITTLTTSTVTKVANLNADLLDGYHAGNSSNNVPISNSMLNTSLNADQLDGYHAGNGSGNVPISNGTTNTNLVAEKAITAWELKLQTVLASTALQSDVCIVEVTTADAVTLTISVGLPIGHQYRIKRTVSSANGISVACSGSETIEGGTSFTVQGSKVSAVLDTGEAVIEKVSSTAWIFVGGQVYGSNSSGSWIKFSDGTMKQWGDSDTATINSGPASSFYYHAYYGSFPVPFIAIPNLITAKSRKTYGSIGSAYQIVPPTTSSWSIEASSLNNTETASTPWNAFGRWK
jgi:hypothetical protein